MAATVATHTLECQDPKRYCAFHFTNVYVDTAETNVVKIDKSTLTGPDGTEPTTLKIVKAIFNVVGYTSVKVTWDHDTDIFALILAGSGVIDFTEFGGLKDTGTGGAGDILFTTAGTTATNTYAITLICEKVD
jgi:hypothetical protein